MYRQSFGISLQPLSSSGFLFLCFFLGLFCASVSWAEPKNIIFYEDNAPFSYQLNSEPEGLWVRLVRDILDDMKIPYRFSMYPFKRALHSAKAGEGVVVGIVKNDERLELLDHSEPFYVERNLLWVREGQSFNFKDIADLSGLVLGIKLGWSYGDDFDRAKHEKKFQAIDGNVKKLYALLDAKRLDALVDNDLAAPKNIASLNLTNKFESLPEPLLLANIYLALKRDSDPQFLIDFNRSLTKLRKQGRLAEIQTAFRKTYMESF
ncbi:substrate-binding periplasmic protein [Litoribrevibacter albus]|uniref:ABC transporter substrate-binding protein n=1 Tax=Litoribrevibacter albus TaxID=1473156 RepID=A0AA37S6U7_9GAMM|nr:transporter substrate-binding domain-containing protein [Litoribrevibacter albus]GLQ30142.1 ABC transporter substrate-binding protein [Litoribrevibacter albus]